MSHLSRTNLNGKAEAFLQEFANDVLLLITEHAQRLATFSMSVIPSHDEVTVCNWMRDDFPMRHAQKFSGSMNHLPLTALIHTDPASISRCIDAVLQQATAQRSSSNACPQQRVVALPPVMPNTARTSPAVSDEEIQKLLLQFSERCLDLMIEHVILLAWGHQPGSQADVAEVSKSEQIATYRSQAIGKPKSGKLALESVSTMAKRINANIDNIAEAAACSLSRTTTSESTRQLSFTRSESRPPAGGSQPKLANASDACRTTGINCGTDDVDDDDRPARKPRGPERSYLPSSMQLEKENTAPTRQRSSSTDAGIESSNAKTQLTASRCPASKPQLQRSKCDAPAAPSSSPAQSELIRDVMETDVSAAPLQRRGVSSKSEKKTRTASRPLAKPKPGSTKRLAGQKRCERDEVAEVHEEKAKSEEKKQRKEGEGADEEASRAVTGTDARLAPAARERQSQRHAGNVAQTCAGEPTTARLDGALDVAPATAVGNLFCVLPRGSESSDRSSIRNANKTEEKKKYENKTVEGTKD